MIIKISEIYLKDKNYGTIVNIKLYETKTIKEILDLLSLTDIGLSICFLNNKIASLSSIVTDNDILEIMPFSDGG